METISVLVDPYAKRTILHPLVAVFLVLLIVLAFAKDRKLAILALVLAINFVTPAQRLYLGVNLTVIRIVVYCLVLRIMARNEIASYKPVRLDYFVFAFVAYSFVSFNALRLTFSAFGASLCTAMDFGGGYLAFRTLLRDDDDVEAFARTMMIVSFVIAALFIVERATARNPFFPFGWAPLAPELRDGKMRLQGPYPHPILAGAYWASMLPYFIAFRKKNGRHDPLMYLALAAGVLIVVLSSSSTSLMAMLAVFPASIFFYQRSWQKKLNYLILFGIIGLSLVMKGPVWSLIARIDLTGSSTGYFRFLLVDSFVRNWREWLVFGVTSTQHWGRGMSLSWAGLGDVANQFVASGVQGGLVGFVAFVGAMVLSFRYSGALVKGAEAEERRYQYWHYGVAILIHAVCFVGVSYYSQVEYAWWFSVAILGSLYARKRAGEAPSRGVRLIEPRLPRG